MNHPRIERITAFWHAYLQAQPDFTIPHPVRHYMNCNRTPPGRNLKDYPDKDSAPTWALSPTSGYLEQRV